MQFTCSYQKKPHRIVIKCLKLATDDSRDICETRKTCKMRDMCTGYFVFFIVSRISNRLVVKAVIMHETKGFSPAITDKKIVRENN